MQLATALRSLVEANRRWWPIDVHVFSDGILETTKERILGSLPDGSVCLNWLPVDASRFRGFATMGHVSKVTFARLLMPQMLPASLGRILYLDADLLVLEDLWDLWNTTLEGALLGAVTDGLDIRIKSGAAGTEEAPRVRTYFNAGVLLIDLERWRQEQVAEKALEYLRQNPGTMYADQDALNVVCDTRWKLLDPRWNTQLDTGDKQISAITAERPPGIVHFVWNQKPWKPSALNVNAQYYDSFRQRTRFARTGWEILGDKVEETWSRSKRTLRPIWHRLRRARD
jgi:lipopolysaccharide biosynthesis glycosyltransferase